MHGVPGDGAERWHMDSAMLHMLCEALQQGWDVKCQKFAWLTHGTEMMFALMKQHRLVTRPRGYCMAWHSLTRDNINPRMRESARCRVGDEPLLDAKLAREMESESIGERPSEIEPEPEMRDVGLLST